MSPHPIHTQLQEPTSIRVSHYSPSPQAKASPPSLPPSTIMTGLPQQQINKPPSVFPMRPPQLHLPSQISSSMPLTLPQDTQHQHFQSQPSPLPSHSRSHLPSVAQERKGIPSSAAANASTESIISERPTMSPERTKTIGGREKFFGTNQSKAQNESHTKTDKHGQQELLSPEAFIFALQQETEFDKKQYAVDISPLISQLGREAGFTQLGRAICEHILAGTKFNFRLVSTLKGLCRLLKPV
ncbi:hypothetical protein BX666DRAFT_1932033 [Dichotomocladium elegans]|nr:hypothetical protein BX666DRAFT_1932033 [Dichotomocladium elegans]